jgi:hypothetical protein
MGGKEKSEPSNGNKLGPTKKLSLDLNPGWIQKQLKGELKFTMGPT